MRNSKKYRGLSLVLIVIIFFSGIFVPMPSVTQAATSSKIKVYDYIKMVVQAIGLEIDDTKSSPYLSAALAAGIVKSGDFEDYKVYLTRTDAAVILDRADVYLNGDTVDSKLLKTVLESRISDITKIAKSKRESVVKVYAKGYMKGNSNGYYIKTREFKGNEFMTSIEAKSVVAMLNDTKKRAKLSPDGQLIRTTNLPKNAKDYPYILESFPNSFYEMKFSYKFNKYYYEPVELKDYASPIKVKGAMTQLKTGTDGKCIYVDDWMKKVEYNLKARLNVDYRTIDSKWINTLSNTYFIFNNSALNKDMTEDIKEYVNFVKKNKIVIQSNVITVEPSTLYYDSGYMVRAYVKFKIDFPNNKLEQEDLFYGRVMKMYDLKRNTWFEGVYDIAIATKNGNSDGSDYAVSDDSLNDYFYKGEQK